MYSFDFLLSNQSIKLDLSDWLKKAVASWTEFPRKCIMSKEYIHIEAIKVLNKVSLTQIVVKFLIIT